MTERLPAHVEVAALLRAVSAAGGFATVLHKGERDAGSLLVVCCENGGNARLYERMPSLDGTREWTLAKAQGADKPHELNEYLDRRSRQDPDLWMIELDIANGERFIGLKDGPA